MPLPRHRPNPKLIQSTNREEENPELIGDYHYVYRTGKHDPKNQVTTDPEYHSSCNLCLTDLCSDSPEGLQVLREKHGEGVCNVPSGSHGG